MQLDRNKDSYVSERLKDRLPGRLRGSKDGGWSSKRVKTAEKGVFLCKDEMDIKTNECERKRNKQRERQMMLRRRLMSMSDGEHNVSVHVCGHDRRSA